MATNATWTVVFDDKKIIKQSGDGAPREYKILDDDAFWNQEKYSNVWAIQYGTFAPSDTVEHRDQTPHCTWEDANLGDFSDFTDKWDAAHLAALQEEWDTDTRDESEKGPRPTSYSSS